MAKIPFVEIKFIDGGLGKIPATADGVPLFVGVSNKGEAKENKVIALTSDKNLIIKQFGDTPFTQRLLDFISIGGRIFYAVKTTKNTAQGILEAMQSAVEDLSADGNIPFEFIAITPAVDKSVASAISSYLENLQANDIFTFAVVSVRKQKDDEDINSYITNIAKEWQGFTSKKVAVVASYATISNLSGTTREDNIIGIVAGLIYKTKVNQHIGEVRSFPLSPITALQKGINKAHLSFLASKNFIVATAYNGKKGFFVANDTKTDVK